MRNSETSTQSPASQTNSLPSMCKTRTSKTKSPISRSPFNYSSPSNQNNSQNSSRNSQSHSNHKPHSHHSSHYKSISHSKSIINSSSIRSCNSNSYSIPMKTLLKCSSSQNYPSETISMNKHSISYSYSHNITVLHSSHNHSWTNSWHSSFLSLISHQFSCGVSSSYTSTIMMISPSIGIQSNSSNYVRRSSQNVSKTTIPIQIIMNCSTSLKQATGYSQMIHSKKT